MREESEKGKHAQLLRDKVAIITGSFRGIGAGIVRLFAEHGAQVAIYGRDVPRLAALHAEIEWEWWDVQLKSLLTSPS